MAQLKKNIISNFFGNGYVVALQFVMVPLLLKYLGAEAYGLVGIYITLLAALNILDFGLSPALSRELAKLSALPNTGSLMRSTVTTLECIYIGIALLICGLFFLSAPWIANDWLKNNNIPPETLVTCLQLIGGQCALQFLTNFYNNGLVGLQRMVKANGVLAINHSLRSLGGICLLAYAHVETSGYFLSQLIFTFIGMLMTAYALYSTLPNSKYKDSSIFYQPTLKLITSRFSIDRFHAIKRFAAGMALTSVLVFFIMQTDKIILSKLVSLEQFGYYTVAINIAVSIGGAATLISKAVLPRMTQLIANHDIDGLQALYIKSSQLVAWLILPLASLLIVFNQLFLTLYLQDAQKVSYIAPVFSFLMFGYSLHSLMYIPYSLSLAYGWTRYGVNISIAALVIMLPLIIAMTIKFGVMGAAATWVILSIGYFILSIPYLHQRCLPSMLSRWYWGLSKPILLSALILVLGQIFKF